MEENTNIDCVEGKNVGYVNENKNCGCLWRKKIECE